MLHVIKSVTINRTRQEVYEFWRDLEHLPTFMIHLEAVTSIGDRRSHWVANAPGGRVEWDAEIIEDRPGEIIGWQSLEGSMCQMAVASDSQTRQPIAAQRCTSICTTTLLPAVRVRWWPSYSARSPTNSCATICAGSSR